MKVRCEKDRHVFTVTPRPHPNAENQSRHYDVNGDTEITCPRCGRGYFFHNGGPDAGDLKGWHSDRPLTVLSQ